MEWWEYQLTQGYGPTSEPLDGPYGGYPHFNKGYDYGVPLNTPIRSIISGTVIAAGDSGDGWGTAVKIQDAYGNIHNYGHLNGANVAVGQTVLAGQLIGASGSTGKSTGPHLSYDVYTPDGTFLDPSQFVAQAPGAVIGASPPMTMDPLDEAIANAIGGTGQRANQVGYSAEELMGAGGVNQALGQIVAQGTLYQLRDDGKYYSVYTQLNPPNTADDAVVFSPNEIATMPGYASHYQQGPNLVVNYSDGSSQIFAQRQGGWAPQSIRSAPDPSKRYVTIPGGATPNPRTPFGGAPPAQESAPNQWDALGLFNAVTQGGAGQRFLGTQQSGHLTPAHSQLVNDVSANQYNNNEMILRSYGIDTSKAEWRDPVAVAAAAATLGARQKGLLEQGYDPTFAASLIQYENNSGISDPLSQQNMVSPYSGGQNIVTGASGKTYSEAFAQNYPQLVI